MQRAIFEVSVAGTDITTKLAPIFTSLTITDNAGTHSDTASLELDDSGGVLILPKPKAPIKISLGWYGGTIREVFRGTVDGVTSTGNRGGGRTLSIQAKGIDSAGRAKEVQQRHFDNETVQGVLRQAGEAAGIAGIEVDPDLANITLPYIEMGESFIHFGQRLARELGGLFRVKGDTAYLAKRAKVYAPSVTAAWGINLHSWNMTPAIGRMMHKRARARAYDADEGREVTVESDDTTTEGAEATFDRRERQADRDSAQRAADGDAATAEEQAGGGSVVIEGTTEAVPDGVCILTGARAGIDGKYRIKTVTHTLTRHGGWTTSLDLSQPQDGAGSDERAEAQNAGDDND